MNTHERSRPKGWDKKRMDVAIHPQSRHRMALRLSPETGEGQERKGGREGRGVRRNKGLQQQRRGGCRSVSWAQGCCS